MRLHNPHTDRIIPDVVPVRSPIRKAVGLRGRRQGRRLFSFRKPTRAPLDMLGVLAPLDIAFLDDDFRVIETVTAEPVTHDPATWRLYAPDEPYSHALEVDAGLLDRLDVSPGHTLRPLDG